MIPSAARCCSFRAVTPRFSGSERSVPCNSPSHRLLRQSLCLHLSSTSPERLGTLPPWTPWKRRMLSASDVGEFRLAHCLPSVLELHQGQGHKGRRGDICRRVSRCVPRRRRGASTLGGSLTGCAPPGREAATGRKIAIKKIKVGLFKDGLDMSAIREVKYLRELRHPNVIEVSTSRRLLSSCHPFRGNN